MVKCIQNYKINWLEVGMYYHIKKISIKHLESIYKIKWIDKGTFNTASKYFYSLQASCRMMPVVQTFLFITAGRIRREALTSLLNFLFPADGSEWWYPPPASFFKFRRLANDFGTDSSILAFISVKTFGIYQRVSWQKMGSSWNKTIKRCFCQIFSGGGTSCF